VTIEEEMLKILDGRSPSSPPFTISDFARQFGANPKIVLGAARRLVDNNQAEAYIVDILGVPTLRALLPIQRQAAAVDASL